VGVFIWRRGDRWNTTNIRYDPPQKKAPPLG
jgi:hypothetical protein